MMLKNYWRIAWRFLTRNKIFTTIHILGLSLGICGCLVLFLITHYEFSFDRDWPVLVTPEQTLASEPLGLSAKEISEIEEFLRALTDRHPAGY